MNQEEISRRIKVILASQQALLRAITPNIREVVVGWNEKDVIIYFIIDGQISNENKAEAERVASKIRTEFPEDLVKAHCLRIDFPTPMNPPEGTAIFVRKEIYPD